MLKIYLPWNLIDIDKAIQVDSKRNNGNTAITQASIPSCISPLEMEMFSNCQRGDTISSLLFIAQILRTCIAYNISATSRILEDKVNEKEKLKGLFKKHNWLVEANNVT